MSGEPGGELVPCERSPSGEPPTGFPSTGLPPPAPLSTEPSVGADITRVARSLAGAAGVLGRRVLGERDLEGAATVDGFGLDAELTDRVIAPLLRPLYRSWFKVDTQRLDVLPREGPALVVSNHSGVLPWDAAMLAVAVHDETPDHRYLRLLAADLVFNTPLLGWIARSGGATHARPADAEALLTAGELVGVFPEGFRGTGKLYRDRYRLQRFGRGGFVAVALRTGAPIIPCAVVGAEESHPMLADVPVLARALGIPYFPITPTWPLLGPLGLAPMPASWTIRLGDPVPTAHLGPDAADDPELVHALADRVRDTIAEMLDELLPAHEA